MNAAAALTRDPRRLAALCELWRASGQEVWITLQGGSMEPALPSGSRLLLRCGAWEPQVGEVAAFRREGYLVVHRILRVEAGTGSGERQFLFQGDANREPDAPVSEGDLVGRVIEVRTPGRLQGLWWGVASRGRAWLRRARVAVRPVARREGGA